MPAPAHTTRNLHHVPTFSATRGRQVHATVSGPNGVKRVITVPTSARLTATESAFIQAAAAEVAAAKAEVEAAAAQSIANREARREAAAKAKLARS